jgi:GNAT superfamily N-acetyltransferase
MSISPEITVSKMRSEELGEASALLGLAYRDNPMMFVLYGDDPEVRRRTTQETFALRIKPMFPVPLVVREGDRVVGVCGFDPPSGSPLTPDNMAQFLALLSAVGPDVPRKAIEMLSDWRTRTPPEPHWNLGPVGVDPAHHGKGIGSALVRAFGEMVDAGGSPAFLETDLEKNARLYAKFGFEIIDQATVIGIPMWFMWRPAS